MLFGELRDGTRIGTQFLLDFVFAINSNPK